jgi:DNA-directed RNA polymerase subunit RPC12/RpoP
MDCPECGKKIPDDALLCPYCGVKIKGKPLRVKNRREKFKSLTSGIWLLIIGGIFLIANFSPYHMGELWPLFLIAIGAGILIQNALKPSAETGKEEE